MVQEGPCYKPKIAAHHTADQSSHPFTACVTKHEHVQTSLSSHSPHSHQELWYASWLSLIELLPISFTSPGLWRKRSGLDGCLKSMIAWCSFTYNKKQDTSSLSRFKEDREKHELPTLPLWHCPLMVQDRVKERWKIMGKVAVIRCAQGMLEPKMKASKERSNTGLRFKWWLSSAKRRQRKATGLMSEKWLRQRQRKGWCVEIPQQLNTAGVLRQHKWELPWVRVDRYGAHGDWVPPQGLPTCLINVVGGCG